MVCSSTNKFDAPAFKKRSKTKDEMKKKHVEEIAKLALVFMSTTKKIRFSKDVKIVLKICIGFHSGKYNWIVLLHYHYVVIKVNYFEILCMPNFTLKAMLLLASLEARCRDTVYLATPLTLLLEWSPPVKQ